MIPLLVGVVLLALLMVAVWRVFAKAGQPGWASLVPVYNLLVLLRIAGRPGWWILLCFIPLINLVVGVIALVGVARRFGKGTGFGIGLVFLPLVFYPILGFGSSVCADGAPPLVGPDSPEPVPPSSAPAQLVRIAGLGRRFGDKWAVKDLDLAFDAGSIVGFIGPNGAGKSTTMRILATLDLPSAGSCSVAGLDCVEDADRVRALIGFMPDSYGAYPDMTVIEYLDFFARAYGLRGAQRRRTVSGIVEFCQLGGLLDRPVAGLSKGMKQRLCLGRCLINDPRVLILDEPTAGLDPRARIEFRDLLRVLAGQGRAILISSHLLSELEEVCDRVAIIELGELVAEGTVAAVKARARAAARSDVQDGPRSVRLELRLAGEPSSEAQAVARLLAGEPALAEVQEEGHDCWTATFTGSARDQARCLARLMAAGLPIYHVSARAENLEDAFMRLTEGKVQ